MFVYLLKLFWFRICMFFMHWYRDGMLYAYGMLLRSFRWIDRKFGMRVNIRFFFQPLYQERNLTGYVLGFLFRTFRLACGAVIAIACAAGIGAASIAWVLVPVFIIGKIAMP